MYATAVNYFANVANIPLGLYSVSPSLGAGLVVAWFLVSIAILYACVDRGPRRQRLGFRIRWTSKLRMAHGHRGLRLRCAEAVVQNT